MPVDHQKKDGSNMRERKTHRKKDSKQLIELFSLFQAWRVRKMTVYFWDTVLAGVLHLNCVALVRAVLPCPVHACTSGDAFAAQAGQEHLWPCCFSQEMFRRTSAIVFVEVPKAGIGAFVLSSGQDTGWTWVQRGVCDSPLFTEALFSPGRDILVTRWSNVFV